MIQYIIDWYQNYRQDRRDKKHIQDLGINGLKDLYVAFHMDNPVQAEAKMKAVHVAAELGYYRDEKMKTKLDNLV